jgi:putative phage-type endonuclease
MAGKGRKQMTRSQWHADRVKSIGASESAGILGVSPWSSPLSVWMDKTSPQPDEQTEWQEWGQRIEGVILEAYHEKTGDDIYQWPQDQHIYHPRFPDVPMSCTPDGGIFVDVMDMDNPGLTKTIDAKNVAAWKRDEWRDGPPLHYVIQMQHQMAVTGAASAALAVLFGGNSFQSYEIERDDAFISELEQACVRFWNDYVVTGLMPPADPSPPTVKALAKLHADDTGDSVDLSTLEAVDGRLQIVNAKLGELKKEKSKLEAHIKAAMGAASYGTGLADGGHYKWVTETQERKAQTLKFRKLRRHKAKQSNREE